MAGSIGAPHMEHTATHERLETDYPKSTSRVDGEARHAHATSNSGGLGGGTAVWLAHSKPYAQTEWIEGGKPWLEPSSVVLAPRGGGAASQLELALALTVAEDVRGKATALRANGALGADGVALGASADAPAHAAADAPAGAAAPLAPARLFDDELQLLLGALVTRAVNGVVDRAQTGARAKAVSALAARVGLPAWRRSTIHAAVGQ